MKIHNLVPAVMSEPGRLSTELARDKVGVVMKIFNEITRASVIMGIHVDAQTAKFNAKESIDHIKKTYPFAHVDDICNAITMGAYGQLKFEGQLTTLSASNIYQWYKELRLNHQDKMVSPPIAPANIEQEVTEEMKKHEMRESFSKFISDVKQHDIVLDIHFEKLLKMGLELTNEDKRKVFAEEMEKLVNNPPIELFYDKKNRELVREMQRYWDTLKDKDTYNYALMPHNPLQKKAVWFTKRTFAIRFCEKIGKEALLAKFDEIYG